MRKNITIILVAMLLWLTLAGNILAQIPKMSLRPGVNQPAGQNNYNVVMSTFTFLPPAKSKPAFSAAAPVVMPFKRDQWLKVKSSQEHFKEAQTRLAEGIEFNLPYESKLNISGRKMINIKTGKIKYAQPDKKTITGTPLGVTDRLDMQQELQVKIKGQVGPKIAVNIDYDDTKEDKRDISVIYKGDPEEVVQEAAFGDIDLTLPQTEFVSYNKKLFGGRIDTLPVSTDNNKLRVMAIGSRTKGVTETKRFKGNTTFEKRELFDTQYIRRKYYKIYPVAAAAATDLPLASGSVEVYIDNRIGNDNTNAKRKTLYDVNGVPRSGDFDKQNAGLDYTVDYRTGVITFNKAIGLNYIIAVDYKRPDGTWLSSNSTVKSENWMVIKDESETPITREMKNYYSLGSTKIVNDPNKFILKVMDLNRNESGSHLYEVDYDFGTIRFLEDTPFDPDVYINIPTHHYIIYVEYRHSVKTYNLRPGLVQKSETVKLNGETLNRDEDYFIDYEIGLLTFLKDTAITDDTDIEVSYEYMPFGGQFQQTIVGARAEYKYGDIFTLGSTVLYNWATSPGTIPDARSTPESILALEGDSKLKLRPEKFWKWDLSGLHINIGAELAQSKYNPDIFGKAMVDNMEGSEIADTVSTDRTLWRLGSLGRDKLLRGKLEWANGDEDKKTINRKTVEVGRDQTLDLTYTLLESDSWVALVYPLATAGVDYSKYNYLQFWVYGEGAGETLHVDLGRVSEDADGKGGFDRDIMANGHVVWPKGSPQTEDLNNNGLLDVGEDIGWEYVNTDDTITRIGAGNGRLDSEDLDGDGILNTVESLATTNNPINITWTGWQQVTIPLNINSSNLTAWQNIKHIRFWLTRGWSSDHTVRIAKIEILGNRWDKPITSGSGTMDITVKSNEDNSEVSLKDNGDYIWLYRDTVNKDLDENKTLVLKYTNLSSGADAYTKRQLSKSLDFSKHQKLRFFIYGDSGGEDFYLRVGSGDNNYYEYRQTIDWKGWQLISVDLPAGFTSTMGVPNLANILMIRLGIIGRGVAGESEIWIDEIHLTEPKEEVGLAQKYSLDSTYKDWGTMNAKYRSVTDQFSLVGAPKVNQDVTARNVAGSLTKLQIKEVKMPTRFNWDQTITITPTTFRTELSTRDEGRVITDNFNAQTVLNKDNLPQLGLSFTRNNLDSNLQKTITKTNTSGATLSYGNKPLVWKPLNLVLPDNFNSYYNRIHGFTYYDGSLKKNPGYEDLFEQTDDWSINPAYVFQFNSKSKPKVSTGKAAPASRTGNINSGLADSGATAGSSGYMNRLTLTPSYKRRKTAETKKFYDEFTFKRNKSDSQTAGLNTTIELGKWFNPTFRYTINTNETYNVIASSKNVNRASTTEIMNMLKMKDLWSWRPLDSLSINSRYKIDEGDIYDNAAAQYTTMNKLWIRKQLGSGNLKSINQLITFENTARWLPFDFLVLKGGWRPFKTIDTTTKYTKTNEHRTTTGTPYNSFAKTFPDITLTIRELENFPAMSVFLEASQLELKYYLKTMDKIDISLTKEDSWGAKWRGKVFKKYTWLLNLDQTKAKETDPTGVTLRNSLANNKGSQVNFRTGSNFIYVLSYDDRIQSEKDRYGIILRKEYTRTPAAKMEKDLEFPKGLRIPFTKKVWQIKNLVHLTTAFKTTILRSNIAEKNYDTYTGSTSVDYNVSYNFVVTLGLDASRVKNKELDINDYYTYGANFKLLIRF
ncbi:MAG: hypothetical protein HY920_04740 [Elusimicrobia bacterium]|nr:hypothetical protein [Elusimicrobiota bacterium]